MSNAFPFPKPSGGGGGGGGGVTPSDLTSAIAAETAQRNAAILVEKNRAQAVEGILADQITQLRAENNQFDVLLTIPGNTLPSNPWNSGHEMPANAFGIRTVGIDPITVSGTDLYHEYFDLHVANNDFNVAYFVNASPDPLTIRFIYQGNEI